MDAKRILADEYEVLGVLGEGGTGVVYDAVRITDRTPIALKVMHSSHAGDKQIRGRFQREAAILRRLEGEHVCPILDFGEVKEGETSLLYLALLKIDGISLADLLKQGPIEVNRALDIMLEVLRALSSAHAQGVIHRDLKPANVLLKDGKEVIVVDFGMSKIITGGGMGTTNLTTNNMVFGTPEYMSPEQARGDELDARCDVYAAGIMLYELLTGSPPFTGTTPLSVLTAHLTSDLDPPSMRPNGRGRVTPPMEAVILHALARERDARYVSADEFAQAIQRARESSEVGASLRPSALRRSPAKPFAATSPAGVVDPNVDVTAKTLVNERAMVSTPAPKVKSSVPPPPRASAPPSNKLWVLVWVVVGLGSIAAGVYFALRS
jgi:serine/threonine-protein kinase